MTQTKANMPRISALQALCLAALLTAAGCTSVPGPDHVVTMPDGAANHPITVEPSYRSLKLAFAPRGISDGDAAQLDAFVADYIAHGNGAIAVSAPANASAQGAIDYFAGRINQMGIARDKILVATHDAPDGDARVEVNYVTYQAHTDKCGDWSDNLAFTLDNGTPRNFGCSVQQNIAAMVADPRDLLGPRPLGESDGIRRTTVQSLYEQGKMTQADKRKVDIPNEQSASSNQ